MVLPGPHVELPAVPRTGHLAALERSFAQRSALVRTDAVQGVPAVGSVEQGHNPAFDHQLARSARRTVAGDGNTNPTRHEACGLRAKTGERRANRAGAITMERPKNNFRRMNSPHLASGALWSRRKR